MALDLPPIHARLRGRLRRQGPHVQANRPIRQRSHHRLPRQSHGHFGKSRIGTVERSRRSHPLGGQIFRVFPRHGPPRRISQLLRQFTRCLLFLFLFLDRLQLCRPRYFGSGFIDGVVIFCFGRIRRLGFHRFVGRFVILRCLGILCHGGVFGGRFLRRVVGCRCCRGGVPLVILAVCWHIRHILRYFSKFYRSGGNVSLII
mmetsp:Transcript_23413/g.49674  ORF Transcript_23413/g.49674 Transcript_23413/m.49674 type:complete len:202 (+) Transcript_23413:405-1010(+)